MDEEVREGAVDVEQGLLAARGEAVEADEGELLDFPAEEGAPAGQPQLLADPRSGLGAVQHRPFHAHDQEANDTLVGRINRLRME